ncbi:MAG: hypothetical protein AAGA06_00210 [Pseudomonadota bacterium]
MTSPNHRAVEFRVQQNGEDVLIYTFKAIDEAAEMFNFLRGFFPEARFIIQPLLH